MGLRAVAVVLAVVGAFVLVPATPSGAQELFTLSGEFECTAPGTITIIWTVGLIGADGQITWAFMSGAAEGDLSDAFSPNPFYVDDLSTSASAVVPGDTIGTVTLNVLLTLYGDARPSVSADVELDGSCEAPPISDPPISEDTPASVQEAATTRPSFTG